MKVIERGVTSCFSVGYYSDDASVRNRLINAGIDESLQVSTRARYEDYQPGLRFRHDFFFQMQLFMNVDLIFV